MYTKLLKNKSLFGNVFGVNRNYFMKNKYTQRGKIFVVFVYVFFIL